MLAASFSQFDPTQTSVEARFQTTNQNSLPSGDTGLQRYHILTSLFELRDQSRQGLGLLAGREVTPGNRSIRKPTFPIRSAEVDLAVFEEIFVAAAHQHRELTAISLEEVAEVEPITFAF